MALLLLCVLGSWLCAVGCLFEFGNMLISCSLKGTDLSSMGGWLLVIAGLGTGVSWLFDV